MKKQRKSIEIPEIARVEGHSAVNVDIVDGKVVKVHLDVFEGTRFFEKIVLGHSFDEIPHITSRICAICSSGHILAASFALEKIFGYQAPVTVQLFRELMHLGMIIESHATHIYALALPDFIGVETLFDLATKYPVEFANWNLLRGLGAKIQTAVGGRPFHPVNLQVGGFSKFPSIDILTELLPELKECQKTALGLCELLLSFPPRFDKTTPPAFISLIPETERYSFFGSRIRCSDGWEAPVEAYKEYLNETAVNYSHAKRSTARGKSLMVGAMARLYLFASALSPEPLNIYTSSPLAKGDINSTWNNFAQSVEILEALNRAQDIIEELAKTKKSWQNNTSRTVFSAGAGAGTGAVECPRGTLYHSYELNENGRIINADMVTPSAQNTARIENDIREVVEATADTDSKELSASLETLVRAYDPCNTCATHMVSVKNKTSDRPD